MHLSGATPSSASTRQPVRAGVCHSVLAAPVIMPARDDGQHPGVPAGAGAAWRRTLARKQPLTIT